MRKLLLMFGLAGIITFVSGCAARVVVIDTQSDVVRLGQGVKGYIYYHNGTNWVKSINKVKLPEGWYAGPGPE